MRKPLQEELFGRHVAGEVFFQNLEQLLGRRDSPELADLLEVYSLCVLLGYLGRYSIASKGDLRVMMGHTDDKINRIRGNRTDLSPSLDAAGRACTRAHRRLAAQTGVHRGGLRDRDRLAVCRL